MGLLGPISGYRVETYLKKELIDTIENSFFSAKKASKILGLKSKRFYRWKRNYSLFGIDGLVDEEPPEEVKRMFSLCDEVPYLPDEERDEAMKEIFDIYADSLFEIGVIGMVPLPVITNINLRNVNTDTATIDPSVSCGTLCRLYQLFWKK